MTDKLKPTSEQIQRACDMARGFKPEAYGRFDQAAFTALGHAIARAEKAEADLGEIDRLLIDGRLTNDGNVQDAAAIAAPYRVETDPLVDVFKALGWGRNSRNGDRIERLRTELAKRGWHVGDQTDAK